MDLPTEFTFNTVPLLWTNKEKIFVSDTIDMQVVTKVDAAGMAFLVKWSKSLPKKKLVLRNSSYQVKNLINTYGLGELFLIE